MHPASFERPGDLVDDVSRTDVQAGGSYSREGEREKERSECERESWEGKAHWLEESANAGGR